MPRMVNCMSRHSSQVSKARFLLLVLRALCIVASVAGDIAGAFEVDTHALMTKVAWDAFEKSRPTVHDDLGIVRSLPDSARVIMRFTLPGPKSYALRED